MCVRCHESFSKVDDLQLHMRVDLADMCSVRPGPPPNLEDQGVTAAVAERLRSRAEHLDWARLWQTLFPRDSDVPDPGELASTVHVKYMNV
jgi:hypothetical protein